LVILTSESTACPLTVPMKGVETPASEIAHILRRQESFQHHVKVLCANVKYFSSSIIISSEDCVIVLGKGTIIWTTGINMKFSTIMFEIC
jgi:hypothetical protein